MCENRFVLFDNKTKDENKKSEQVKKLVSFINMVSLKNAGKPYTSEMFNELKVKDLLSLLMTYCSFMVQFLT